MAALDSLSRQFTGGMPDRKRISIACGLLLAIEIAIFMFMAAGTRGLIVPLPHPISTDFVSFYAAGSLADAGAPQLAYDKIEHYGAEERATQAGIEYNFFYYPPTFLLLCAAFAQAPYLMAFLLFEGATLLLYLFVARHILGERGWAILVPLLAFPPVFWNFGVGQNAFLTAALFGAGTLYIDRRPLFAGMLFGALCYKPQFGLLIPIALAAGGHWRAFVAALVSAVVLCLLSLAGFGWETWRDFITALSASSTVYATGRIPFTGYINAFGALRLLGVTQSVAYAVQIGATLTAAAVVAMVWRRRLPLPIRAASLASWALLAAPLALFYDLMLGAVAALWLIRGDGTARLADWEKIALSGLFLLSLSPRTLAEAWHLPVGPFIALALTAMVTAQGWRYEAVHR